MKWEAESIGYLGISLSKGISKLFDLNYGLLNTKIKSDILRWKVIPLLSWSSRVESIKINILPRMLYLFQTLPVKIATKQFMEWDRLISRHYGKGKKTGSGIKLYN